MNPSATVTSIDGVGAFDLISRRAMLGGLAKVDGGVPTLPFVRMFYGSPSQCLWEDDSGVSHTRGTSSSTPRNLREGEFLFAFTLVQSMLPCRILCGVTQGSGSMLVRPRCGTRQACSQICDVLERMARDNDPSARVLAE